VGVLDPVERLAAEWATMTRLTLASEVGLVNGILTYDQRLTIGVTVDPRLVSDVWLYVECLKASFAELLRAADAAERAGAGIPAPATLTR
jgi:hypothetical protein